MWLPDGDVQSRRVRRMTAGEDRPNPKTTPPMKDAGRRRGVRTAALSALALFALVGLAIGVLLRQWLMRKRPDRMLLKVVTEGLRNDHDLKDIHGRKVGDILYRGQGVVRETRGGETFIKLDEAKARQLAASVGLKLEDFALSTALDAATPPVNAAALSTTDGHKEKKLPHD